MKAPDILFKKLCYLLHRSLVDARSAALARHCERVYNLADAFEIVPTLMADWEEAHLELIRSILASFEAKYPEKTNGYLSILDMDEENFLEVYCARGGYQ